MAELIDPNLAKELGAHADTLEEERLAEEAALEAQKVQDAEDQSEVTVNVDPNLIKDIGEKLNPDPATVGLEPETPHVAKMSLLGGLPGEKPPSVGAQEQVKDVVLSIGNGIKQGIGFATGHSLGQYGGKAIWNLAEQGLIRAGINPLGAERIGVRELTTRVVNTDTSVPVLPNYKSKTLAGRLSGIIAEFGTGGGLFKKSLGLAKNSSQILQLKPGSLTHRFITSKRFDKLPAIVNPLHSKTRTEGAIGAYQTLFNPGGIAGEDQQTLIGDAVRGITPAEHILDAFIVNNQDSPLVARGKHMGDDLFWNHMFMSVLPGTFKGLKGGASWFRGLAGEVAERLFKKNPEQAERLVKSTLEKTAADGDNIIEQLKEVQKYEQTELDRGLTRERVYTSDTALPHQGRLEPTAKPSVILNQLDEIDNSWVAKDHGTTSSPMTVTTRKRLATEGGALEPHLKKITQELLGDAQYQAMLKEAKSAGKTFSELHKGSLNRMHEMMGRLETTKSSKKFWEPFNLNPDRSIGIDHWRYDELVSAELTTSALFKKLRDVADYGDEVFDAVDVLSKEGPMQQTAELLVDGLVGIKRAKYLWGKAGQMQQLTDPASRLYSKAGAEKLKKEVAEYTTNVHKETVDGVSMMMQFLKNSDSDEVASGILQIFKQSDRIHNWTDFDNFLRQQIRGGYFNGKVKSGALTKKLIGVYVNSALSGPKTPVRALIGTTLNTYLNSWNHFLGAIIKVPFGGDIKIAKSAGVEVAAGLQLIPDALTIFQKRMKSNWNAPIESIKTRFTDPALLKAEADWELYGKWAYERGTDGDKAAYNVANIANKLNSSKWTTANVRIMKSIDDTFQWLLAKKEARRSSMLEGMNQVESGIIPELTPDYLGKLQDIEYKKLLDSNGNIDLSKNSYLQKQFEEVTLTKDLQGFSKALESAFNQAPLLKPFFLFARTGVNGLALTYKNTPALGLLHQEVFSTLNATKAQVLNGDLMQYGIKNMEDLTRAKDLIIGRQVTASGVVLLASMAYMNDKLRGNGPENRQMRQMFKDSGWKARTLDIGNVTVSLDAFEPFNQILYAVADVGDNMKLMGPEWATEKLQKITLALVGASVSKSYLSTLSQLLDALNGKPGAWGQVQTGLLNTSLPLASLRKDVGVLLNNYMPELSSDIREQIRAKNMAFEHLTGITGVERLSPKYDMFYGGPLNKKSFMQRLFEFGSPVQFNINSNKPGLRLLYESQYDLRLSTWTSPDGVSLKNESAVRSLFQDAISKTKLGPALDRLSKRTDVQASLREMRKDIKNGNFQLNPMKAYVHNKLIKRTMNKHRQLGWKMIQNDPRVIELQEERLDLLKEERRRFRQTQSKPINTQEILNIPK